MGVTVNASVFFTFLSSIKTLVLPCACPEYNGQVHFFYCWYDGWFM